MRTLQYLCLSALLTLFAFPGFGQTDDALFDSPDAGVVHESVSDSSDVAGKLLGTDSKTTLFGEFRAQGTAVWAQADPTMKQALSLDMGLTARPDKNLRIGAKGAWAFDPAVQTGAFHVSEAFADFQGLDKAYFRVGKQFVSWGKGLYYSPADVLSLSSIDPTDATAAREGPTSLKASLEAGTWGTYQSVMATEGASSGSDVTFSGQGTWVLLGTELSLGGFYQPALDKSPRIFATAGFSLFDFNWYTESVLLRGNDQKRLVEDGTGGLSVLPDDGSLTTQQTLGFSYTGEDSEKRWTVNAAAQYYYNGTAASALSLYRDRPLSRMELVKAGTLSLSNLRGYGTHYLAGTLGLSDIAGSTVSLSCSAFASLSEASGRVSPRLSWVVGPDLTLGAQTTLFRGPTLSEYAQPGNAGSWQADIKIFSHLNVAFSGPLPGSEADIDPQLKISLEGFSF